MQKQSSSLPVYRSASQFSLPVTRDCRVATLLAMTEGWIPAFAGMTEEESGMTEEDFTLTPPSPLKGENSIEY